MDAERWKRVDTLLQAALRLPGEQQKAFLLLACDGDSALETEVQSLLESHRKLGDFLEQPLVEAAIPQEQGTETGDNNDPLLNQTIAHYKVLRRLGSGGMGMIYEAEDLRLGRHVALKLLLESQAGRKSLLRFQQEARAISSLNHPNICTVYGIEEYDGKPVIVMELLKGQTLEGSLKAGRVPLPLVLQWAVEVADALEAAHSIGLIHRDIKPGNVFLTHRGTLKILDFGLAKPCGREGNDGLTADHDEPLTSLGVIPGTTAYMSPEQLRCDELDERTDIFSLGVMLYEMLTGERPFAARNTVLTMDAILNKQPVSPRKINPDLPLEVEQIVGKALEKDRALRYRNAADMRADLRRLQQSPEASEKASAQIASPTKLEAGPVAYVSRFAGEVDAIRDHFFGKPVEPIEPPCTNLPMQRTAFVGRERELTALKELLMRPDVRLVTVTGPGGIGKTRLAVQLASGLTEQFPGGIHLVPLFSISDPDLIASVIVQTLGIGEAGGQSPLEMLKEHLRDSSHAPVLLLLDSFEHLVSAVSTVAEFLTVRSNLKIIVTSRAALHIYGEHEFPVPPLAMPDALAMPAAAKLRQYPAIALFVQRAVAVKPDFELNQDNASCVAEICTRLDGLPLAIELAAARIKVLSPLAMRTRLTSRLHLLTGGGRDRPQRQQTLRAAMDWSHDLLNASEQKLFRRLSVFMGGCTLEGAEAVCDTKGDLELDLLDTMASLVDKSLVQQFDEGAESRYAMLETIREYAMEKLEASGEEAATKRALAAYCLVLAEEATQSNEGELDWLRCLSAEHANLRAAVEWLTAAGEADWGLRLGSALFRFWETREYLSEGRSHLAKLLELPGAASRTKSRSRALFAAGVLAGGQGDYSSADLLLRESLDISRQLQDRQGAAVALNALAVVARDRGQLPAARALFEESVELWKELADQRAVALSLSNLATVVRLQGDNALARSLHDESLLIFRELGDHIGVAWSLNYQGDIARDQHDYPAARTLYDQALAIFRELGDRWGTAGTLADLGSLCTQQENYSTARALYRESAEIFRQLDHKRGIARILECFACVASAELEAETALRLAGAAAALRQNIGAPLPTAEQVKLDASLRPAWQALTNDGGNAAWSAGLALPVERAIEEVLMAEAESSSSSGHLPR